MPIFPPPPGAILSSWCIVATTPVADKNVWSIQKYFIAEKLKSVFTLVIEYSGKLWLTKVLLNIYLLLNSGKPSLGPLAGRLMPSEKRKELIRHVKTIPNDMKFVQLYHERAETSITIATRINSSFYIDTTRPLPSSVGFSELSLPPMLSLYKPFTELLCGS